MPDAASTVEIAVFGSLLCFSKSKYDLFLLFLGVCYVSVCISNNKIKGAADCVALKDDTRFQGPTWL